MIQAIIFDMDGLLIDSEPVWVEAEIEVFSKVGVPLTPEMTKQTMGLRSDEVVRHWHQRFPWDEPSQKAVDEELIQTMVTLLGANDIARPGVQEIIALFEKLELPMAIASSSPRRLINAAIHKLAIDHKMKVIHSAEHEPYGKPHPGVYISAAEKLGVNPEYCLAFEDSPNGILAAKAAKMKCIAVPDEKMQDSKVFGIADRVLASLRDFTPAILKEL